MSNFNAQICNELYIIKNELYKQDRKLLSKQQICDYSNILALYSSTPFEEDIYEIKLPQIRLPRKFDFSKCSDDIQDKTLLKSFIIDELNNYSNPALCVRRINDCAVFLKFLGEIHIENVVTAIIVGFVQYLNKNESLSNSQRRNIYLSTKKLLRFMESLELLNTTLLILPEKDWISETGGRVSPDKTALQALDIWFFNLKNEIPLVYRCMYCILRMILTRFTEVQEILLDSIGFPTEKIFSISIPTKKETDDHIPFYTPYSRRIDGRLESILFSCILKQQEIIKKEQDKLPKTSKGYLMVSLQTKELVSNDEFDDYLATICNKQHVVDTDGNGIIITSHLLRHAGVFDRKHSDFLNLTLASIEANHNCEYTTNSYGYPDRKYLEDITKKARIIVTSEFIDTKEELAETYKLKKEFKPIKYTRLLRQSGIRLIPYLGLCCDISCRPRYIDCFKCDFFEPESFYAPYFEECVVIIQERIDKQKLSKRPNNSNIEEDEAQLVILLSFLKLLEKNKNKVIS